jgi:hypothetical protein
MTEDKPVSKPQPCDEAIIAVNKDAIRLLRACLKNWPYDSDQGSVYQEVLGFLNGHG